MVISSRSYTFDPRPNSPFLITAKRYWKSGTPYLEDPSALTLVLTHGTGFHKEQWEPTIEELYLILDNSGGSVKICDIWAIDAPNHGDAAVLNENALLMYDLVFPWVEFGRDIHNFLTSFGKGIDVDFSKRRLVGIGHSKGAICLLLSLGHSPKLKYESLILCEPICVDPGYSRKISTGFAAGAANRRDNWLSREEAYKQLKARQPWKDWDDRVLRIFVQEGMRTLHTSDYPQKIEGVTLKCTRLQEAASYRDTMAAHHAYNSLGAIARRLPVHLIYGALNDVLAQSVKDDIIENSVGGLDHLASFSRLEGAGHLIVQMNPAGLARKIYEALMLDLSGTAAKL